MKIKIIMNVSRQEAVFQANTSEELHDILLRNDLLIGDSFSDHWFTALEQGLMILAPNKIHCCMYQLASEFVMPDAVETCPECGIPKTKE